MFVIRLNAVGFVAQAIWPTMIVCLISSAASLVAASAPNVLVIVADDLGYADVGFNGCRDIPTPHLDALARRSVRCTAGYVTYPVCSPSRAGLLTGRHQARFGYETNPDWAPDDDSVGLPLSETLLPNILKGAGYVTGCVGKWHLGGHAVFHPNRRGFDEYFGTLHGGHRYLPNTAPAHEFNMPLDRNGRPEPLQEHLTDVLSNEASKFVRGHDNAPWFLYLAFNAPHGPLESTPELIQRASHIKDNTRRNYAALVIGLDDAVGAVMDELERTGQMDTTLVFFVSDNGGTPKSHSDNGPLRGHKGGVFEGGIRVPFLVSWPDRLPAGINFELPVSTLDIVATAVSASGAEVPKSSQLEGVDLIPFLTGASTGQPHEFLYWRKVNETQSAVRHADWKLVRVKGAAPQLYNLTNDLGETTDLAASHPDIVAQLTRAYDDWNRANVTPLPLTKKRATAGTLQ